MNHHIGSRVRLFEQKENMASSSMSSNESMLSYFHLRRSGRRIDSQETLILGKTDGDTELPDSRPVEFEAVRSSAELAAFFPMQTCLSSEKLDQWWRATVPWIPDQGNSATRRKQPWGRTGSGCGPVNGFVAHMTPRPVWIYGNQMVACGARVSIMT